MDPGLKFRFQVIFQEFFFLLLFFYLLAAVGFLVKAFVVLHIQSHFADLTAETSFVPIL